jgi:hypothetical protein
LIASEDENLAVVLGDAYARPSSARSAAQPQSALMQKKLREMREKRTKLLDELQELLGEMR